MPDQTKNKGAEFLTARQLAEILQVSQSTIHRLRRAGQIPAVVLTSRIIRFNLRDVKNALRARTHPPQNQERAQQNLQLTFEDFLSDLGDEGR